MKTRLEKSKEANEDLNFINLLDIPTIESEIKIIVKSTNEKKGYIYNNKFRHWGEELIKFVNSDFSKLEKNVQQICQVINSTNITSLFIILSPLLNTKSSSLYEDVLQNYANSLLDIESEIKPTSDELNGKVFTYDIHTVETLLNDLYFSFFSIYHKYQSIFNMYLSNKKNISKDEVLKNIIKRVNYISCSYQNSLFPVPSVTQNIKEISSSSITTEITFTHIEALCKYEFIHLLQTNRKIYTCPYCNKIFIANSKHKKYCSTKCQQKYITDIKNNDKYFKCYRKFQKYVYAYTEQHEKIPGKHAEKQADILFKMKNIHLEYENMPKDQLTDEYYKTYEKRISDLYDNFKQAIKLN